MLRKVRTLFRKAQEAIDWLNRGINDSILGAALTRLRIRSKFESQNSCRRIPRRGTSGSQHIAAIRELDPGDYAGGESATVIIYCWAATT